MISVARRSRRLCGVGRPLRPPHPLYGERPEIRCGKSELCIRTPTTPASNSRASNCPPRRALYRSAAAAHVVMFARQDPVRTISVKDDSGESSDDEPVKEAQHIRVCDVLKVKKQAVKRKSAPVHRRPLALIKTTLKPPGTNPLLWPLVGRSSSSQIRCSSRSTSAVRVGRRCEG